MDNKTVGTILGSLAAIAGISYLARKSGSLSEKAPPTADPEVRDNWWIEKNEPRTIDKIAQKDYLWTREEYPEDFRAGLDNIDYEDVFEALYDIVNRGDDLVIHGRDGELYYQLLMNDPRVDKSKVHYVITSRPLTTMRQGPMDPGYEKYLRSNIPPNAVHFDLGFAGSIPKWVDKNIAPVKSIQMIAASNHDLELPLTRSWGKNPVPQWSETKRREFMLKEEKGPSRFDVSIDGRIRHSPDAGRFWAKFYGVQKGIEKRNR